eukprot:gene51508-57752_t
MASGEMWLDILNGRNAWEGCHPGFYVCRQLKGGQRPQDAIGRRARLPPSGVQFITECCPLEPSMEELVRSSQPHSQPGSLTMPHTISAEWYERPRPAMRMKLHKFLTNPLPPPRPAPRRISVHWVGDELGHITQRQPTAALARPQKAADARA